MKDTPSVKMGPKRGASGSNGQKGKPKMGRTEFRVEHCPVDPHARPPSAPYRAGQAYFTSLDIAGMLYDSCALPGMLLSDKTGRVWEVGEAEDGTDGGTLMVIRQVEPSGEGYRYNGGLVVTGNKAGTALYVLKGDAGND